MTTHETASRSGHFRHRHIAVDGGSVHVVEGGQPDKPAIVFLHGWPEDWSAFRQVMILASKSYHVIAIDLPGVGRSTARLKSGSKRLIARSLQAVLQKLKLQNITLVGHDIGGQVAYAYARLFHQQLARVVIMDVAIPGVEPWSEVLHNPYIWHFAFHTVPGLPEKLVHGKEREYFDFFYTAIAARPQAIARSQREGYVQAYSKLSALRTGFGWYRAFEQDAKENAADTASLELPVLYMRGDHEGGEMPQYVRGLRQAGFTQVRSAVIKNCGHFAPEEQPREVWRYIASFIAR